MKKLILLMMVLGAFSFNTFAQKDPEDCAAIVGADRVISSEKGSQEAQEKSEGTSSVSKEKLPEKTN